MFNEYLNTLMTTPAMTALRKEYANEDESYLYYLMHNSVAREERAGIKEPACTEERTGIEDAA